LRNFSAQSAKQRLDIPPKDIGPLRFLENGFKGFTVFAVHGKIISENDTTGKGYGRVQGEILRQAQYSACQVWSKKHPRRLGERRGCYKHFSIRVYAINPIKW
jgi:hypothetical protein